MMLVSPGSLAPDVQALAGDYPDYVAALACNRRWNFAANMLDSGTFGPARAALSKTATLPYFHSQMTANAFVIGLSPAIARLWQYAPQLVGAYLVHNLTRRRPYIVLMAWLERVAILAMLVIALTIGRLPTGPVLAGFLAA